MSFEKLKNNKNYKIKKMLIEGKKRTHFKFKKVLNSKNSPSIIKILINHPNELRNEYIKTKISE